MTSFIKKNSKWRWIIGIILIILIVFLSLQLIVNLNLNPFLENLSKKAIKDASNDLYEIKYREFNFNLATATLTIKDLELQPDTLRYKELLEKDSAAANLFWVHVPTVRIHRINLLDALIEKRLIVKDILFSSPSIKVSHYPQVAEKDSTEDFNLRDLIQGHFNFCKVRKLNLDDLSLVYSIKKENAPKPFHIKNINLNLNNLVLDSANLQRQKFTDDIDFSVRNFSYKLPDSLYIIKIKEVGISQLESRIFLDSVELIPRFSSYEFSKKVGIETDRMAIKTKRIVFDHVDMGSLLGEQKFIAGLLSIENSIVDVFRDKRYPEDLTMRPKTLHMFLKDLDFYLKIDTIKIVKADVKYREHVEGSSEQAFIDFNKLYASIYNFTSDSAIIKNKKLIVDAQAYIFNKSLLNAHFSFDIAHPRGHYQLKGSLKTLDLTQFNDLMLPMASVKIEDGHLHNAAFSITADDHEGRGTMEFKYDNLKIKILDNSGESGFKEKITSFVANTFVVKKDNPNGGNLRQGVINFVRDQSKSMFHFWGRLMLTGVASSVGISEDKVKAEAKNSDKLEKRSKRSI